MEDYVGKYVKQFESGKDGSYCLDQCGNDWGLSCGSYQMTLRWGNCINFLKRFYPALSKELYFNSKKPDIQSASYPGKEYCSSPEEVKEIWLACLEEHGEEGFFQNEWQYTKEKYYLQILKVLKGIYTPTSRAMQECFWSWALHKGWQGAEIYFKEVLKENKIQDPQTYPQEKLFDLIYEKRYKINPFVRYKKGMEWSEPECLRPLLNKNLFKGVDDMGYIKLKKEVKIGDKGEHVKLAQARIAQISEEYEKDLQSHSLDDVGEYDGIYGAGMQKLVFDIQKELGINATGNVDLQLIEFLNRDFIKEISKINKIEQILK